MMNDKKRKRKKLIHEKAEQHASRYEWYNIVEGALRSHSRPIASQALARPAMSDPSVLV